MSSTTKPSRHTRAFRTHLPVLILLYALAVAGYYVFRYRGQWIETDTATITRITKLIQEQGTLSTKGLAYNHGFGYQVLSIAIVSATGLPLETLQTIVYPFLAVVGLGLTSLAFFTQVTNDRRVAVLATLFLFLQPDVLFVTLRGSHEKLDWPLMMVALTLLYQSTRRPSHNMAACVGLFYLSILAMIATNVFFASTFLIAVIIGLALGAVANSFLRRRSSSTTNLRRLVYVSLSCSVLIFIFLFYIYPLALSNLRLLRTIFDRVSALLLNFEIEAQPYAYISFGWVSPSVYLGLTAFTWLLIGASFVEWLWRAKQILAGREKLELSQSVDWLLYAGFATQVALSIVVDLAGVLSSNLQLRVFPGFTVIAVGLLARAVWRIAASPRLRGWSRRAVLGFVGLAVAWFALASVLKATNEIALSNKWSFYSTTEDVAIGWANRHADLTATWTGLDERIRELFRFKHASPAEVLVPYDVASSTDAGRYVLFSERERLRGLRMGLSLPITFDWNRVYDNGDVQLNHRRSQTPYQR